MVLVISNVVFFSASIFTTSIFLFAGFVEGLKRGHDRRLPPYKSLVLLRPKVQSSIGAAILGAKSIGENFPVDYSKNTESFFTFTPGSWWTVFKLSTPFNILRVFFLAHAVHPTIAKWSSFERECLWIILKIDPHFWLPFHCSRREYLHHGYFMLLQASWLLSFQPIFCVFSLNMWFKIMDNNCTIIHQIRAFNRFVDDYDRFYLI